jgi:uncharacterized membrane protein
MVEAPRPRGPGIARVVALFLTVKSAPVWVDAESDAPAVASHLRWLPWTLLALLTLADAVGFSWLSVARHQAFQSHAFDLGNMDQAAWSTIHGQFLRFTDMAVGKQVLTTRLAIHVEPLLAVLSIFYFLHDGPETLLVLQAVIVASGAIPAYLLARSVLGGAWLSLVFPLAYLLHPSLQNAVLDDFHAVTMASCFLLWAILFLQRGMMVPYAVAAILAGATKEEVGLLVAGLGVWLMLRRRWYAGFMSVVGGLGWFLISVLVIIPAANPGGSSPYLGRYGYLGKGVSGVVLAPIRHPGLLARTLVSDSRLAYLSDLFHPVGFVSLLGLPVVLLSLPALLINMLSSDARMYSGFYQYSAEVIPYVIAGAIFGIAAISSVAVARRVPGARRFATILCVFVLIAAAVDNYRYGFTPLAAGYIVPSAGPHQRLEEQMLRRVPVGAPVAAADEIEPHLAHRKWIYLLPTVHPVNGPAAKDVILDASIPSRPVEPHNLHGVVIRLLRRGYGIREAKDGLLWLERGAGGKTLDRSFFSFALPAKPTYEAVGSRWGPLRLVGIVVHPRGGTVNRSRPAVEVEAFWRTSRRLPSGTKIVFRLSPVYSGAHPRLTTAWQTASDSPTLAWLPIGTWPRSQTIETASLDMVPTTDHAGRVDVAVSVVGLGRARGLHGTSPIRASSTSVRVATIGVDP